MFEALAEKGLEIIKLQSEQGVSTDKFMSMCVWVSMSQNSAKGSVFAALHMLTPHHAPSFCITCGICCSDFSRPMI